MKSDSLSNKIQVIGEATYLEEQSDPENSQFSFSYLISIKNTSNDSVQLMRRYWKVTDANNQITEVEGEGVIGKQPIIHPGQTYRYTSGVVIQTIIASMTGHYSMISSQGEHFIVPISAFTLASKYALH